MTSRTVSGAPAPKMKRSPYLYAMTSSRDAGGGAVGGSSGGGGGLKRTKPRPIKNEGEVAAAAADNPPRDFFDLKRRPRSSEGGVLRHGGQHQQQQGDEGHHHDHVAFVHTKGGPGDNGTTTNRLASRRSVTFHTSVHDLKSQGAGGGGAATLGPGHASVAAMGGPGSSGGSRANEEMGAAPNADAAAAMRAHASAGNVQYRYKYEHSVGSLKRFLDDTEDNDPAAAHNARRNQRWKTVTPDGVDPSVFGTTGMMGSKSVGNLHHQAQAALQASQMGMVGRQGQQQPPSPGAKRRMMARSATVAGGGGLRSAGLAYGSAHFRQTTSTKAEWVFPSSGAGGGGGNDEWTTPSAMLSAAARQGMGMQTIPGSNSSLHSTGMGAMQHQGSQASVHEITASMTVCANSPGMAVASATRGLNALELKVKEMEERQRQKKEEGAALDKELEEGVRQLDMT